MIIKHKIRNECIGLNTEEGVIGSCWNSMLTLEWLHHIRLQFILIIYMYIFYLETWFAIGIAEKLKTLIK